MERNEREREKERERERKRGDDDEVEVDEMECREWGRSRDAGKQNGKKRGKKRQTFCFVFLLLPLFRIDSSREPLKRRTEVTTCELMSPSVYSTREAIKTPLATRRAKPADETAAKRHRLIRSASSIPPVPHCSIPKPNEAHFL